MSAKKYHITLNNKVYEVEIEEVKEENNNEHKNKPSTPKSTSVSESITAPMPGTILNVLVKKGESVKKGQVVAILEAMKMENEIVATVDGVIEDINIDKGQNVNLGDNLLKIA